jgi:hypothetical protein
MILLGFLLLMTGAVLNVILLRGRLSARLTPQQIVRSWPWIGSLALVIAGLALIVIGGR